MASDAVMLWFCEKLANKEIEDDVFKGYPYPEVIAALGLTLRSSLPWRLEY